MEFYKNRISLNPIKFWLIKIEFKYYIKIRLINKIFVILLETLF